MVSYIGPDDDPTDPDDLAEAAYAEIIEGIPGYTPNDNSLENWLILSLSRIAATNADVAKSMPLAAFRYFGETVIGLQPRDDVAATTNVTVNAIDNAGYTIPAGTNFGFQITGDTLVEFTSTNDVTIPPGQFSTATGAVQIQALTAGASGNGYTPDQLQLIDALAWVASVSATGATAGGIDGETDDQYIQRLIVELQLSTPTPILPAEFGVIATNVTGVFRAVGIGNYDPGYPSPTFTVTPSATGGTLTAGATYHFAVTGMDSDGNETLPATVTAMMPSGGGNTCSVTITWIMPDARSDLEPLDHVAIYRTAPNSSGPYGQVAVNLSAPSAHTVTGSEGLGTAPPTENGTTDSSVERVVSVAVVDDQGATLSDNIKDQVAAYLNSVRELGFICYVIDPTYTEIDIQCGIIVDNGADIDTVVAAVQEVLTTYFAPATWGVDPDDATGTSWTDLPYIFRSNVFQTLLGVTGVRYVSELQINESTNDIIPINGPASLTTPGTMNVIGVIYP